MIMSLIIKYSEILTLSRFNEGRVQSDVISEGPDLLQLHLGGVECRAILRGDKGIVADDLCRQVVRKIRQRKYSRSKINRIQFRQYYLASAL